MNTSWTRILSTDIASLQQLSSSRSKSRLLLSSHPFAKLTKVLLSVPYKSISHQNTLSLDHLGNLHLLDRFYEDILTELDYAKPFSDAYKNLDHSTFNDTSLPALQSALFSLTNALCLSLKTSHIFIEDLDLAVSLSDIHLIDYSCLTHFCFGFSSTIESLQPSSDQLGAFLSPRNSWTFHVPA